jgi:membrane-associated protease RseP (regulator of RpoE activity)
MDKINKALLGKACGTPIDYDNVFDDRGWQSKPPPPSAGHSYGYGGATLGRACPPAAPEPSRKASPEPPAESVPDAPVNYVAYRYPDAPLPWRDRLDRFVGLVKRVAVIGIVCVVALYVLALAIGGNQAGTSTAVAASPAREQPAASRPISPTSRRQPQATVAAPSNDAAEDMAQAEQSLESTRALIAQYLATHPAGAGTVATPAPRPRAWIGVDLHEMTSEAGAAEGLGPGAGALVANVASGSPAAKANLASGDVILMVDGRLVRTVADVQRDVQAHAAGNPVMIDIVRARNPYRVEVVPAVLPE